MFSEFSVCFTLLIITIGMSQAISPEIMTKYENIKKNLIDKCLETTNLSAEEFEAVTNGDGEGEINHEVKCMISCLKNEFGFDLDGDSITDNVGLMKDIEQEYPEDYRVIVSTFRECISEIQEVEDECENDFQLSECHHRKLKEKNLQLFNI